MSGQMAMQPVGSVTVQLAGSTLTIIVSAAGLLLAFSASCLATVYQGAADVPGTFTVGLNGSWGLPYQSGPTTDHLDLTIGDNPGQIRYDATQITTTSVSFVQTQTFSVNGSLTDRRQLTATVKFDALTISETNSLVRALVAPGGNTFDAVPPLTEANFSGSPVTGTYSIAGPTQTVSGMFSIPLNQSGTGEVLSHVDASAFPASVSLSSLSVTQFNSPGYGIIFDGTVEGIDVQLGLNNIVATVAVPVQVPLTPGGVLPDPPSLALLSFTLCFTKRRRRKAGPSARRHYCSMADRARSVEG